ncbi:capsid maturation protease [Streptomyces phage Evy]|uniref:Capsid maturation protease n=2 Tax=Samistivirus TaxID=2560220 RepID=A0A0A0RQG2_9CAUD|nr:head maturation protease [Streptomyces phage Jay2Jay]YP_010103426.1 head maturation protease [Streptomyces phage Evy]AIW02552.1 capsid maturation protease [Streptomyces phage Jay2Jay]QDH93917.1 capsid maturation protease [Streptomyces phage Evy]
MKIEKASWHSDEHNVRLTMPIAKYDVEKRQVSGFATLDNFDSHGDIVLAEASQKAFARFRGNIREMHQPIAVGKLVDFREEEFYDSSTQKFFRGIFATAYVSKGAQDTWEKVLDGTLSGFSIGGSIVDSDTEWNKDAQTNVRFIKDYELIELSLVDNPANQLANIFSIEKVAGGDKVMKGMVVETSVENVFWCPADEIAKTTTEESANCSACGKSMQNIGWFETDSNRQEAVKNLVQEFTKSSDKDTEKGGAEQMADERKDDVAEQGRAESETPVEESTTENAPEVEADGTVESEETAAEVDEGGAEEPNFEKMLEQVQETIKKGLEQTREATAEEIKTIETKVDEINKAFDSKFSELVEKHGELSKKFDSLSDQHDEVAKRLDSVESETAIKKSGDVGTSKEETITKGNGSKWGGHFLSVSDIK